MSALTTASRGGRSPHIFSPMAFANALPAAVGGIVEPADAPCVQPLRTIAASPSVLAVPPTNDLLVSDIWLSAPRAKCAIEPNASTCSPFRLLELERLHEGLQKYFCELPNVTICIRIWYLFASYLVFRERESCVNESLSASTRSDLVPESR